MAWFDFDGHAGSGDDENAANAGVKGSVWSGKSDVFPKWLTPWAPALTSNPLEGNKDVQIGAVDAFWGQSKDGKEAGAKLDLSTVKSDGEAWNLPSWVPLLGGTQVKTESAGPNLSAHAFATDETIDAGIGANAGQFAATLGGQLSKDSQTDGSVRGGFSEGAGAGWRLHHGDSDGDKVRELGFGIDAGPLTFDVKSEWLGGLYKDYQQWKGPPVGWPEDKPWEPGY